MTACVIWTGAKLNSGYGSVRFQGRSHLAHRVAYIRAHGEIPDGLQIDHLCRQRLCVNPEHLEAVTQQENIRRQFAARQDHDPATHCRAGHERTAENTRIQRSHGRSRRICRLCMAGYQRAYRQRRNAPVEAVA